MENEQNSFKLVVLVAAILALLFVAFLVTKKFVTRNTDQSDQPKSAVVQKTNVDFGKDPEKFPSDIPVEAGARITQNYNATTPSGLFQATKVFVTEQSLASNLTIYTKFMNDNGWDVTATVDQPTFKMVSGKKEDVTLQVSIDQNSVTNERTVSISYVEKN